MKEDSAKRTIGTTSWLALGWAGRSQGHTEAAETGAYTNLIVPDPDGAYSQVDGTELTQRLIEAHLLITLTLSSLNPSNAAVMLSSKVQDHKGFCKLFETCHVGTH